MKTVQEKKRIATILREAAHLLDRDEFFGCCYAITDQRFSKPFPKCDDTHYSKALVSDVYQRDSYGGIFWFTEDDDPRDGDTPDRRHRVIALLTLAAAVEAGDF